MTHPSAGARLRVAVHQERPLQVVGTINAYSALLAERAGFRAIYLSGAGVANASFGLQDLGITMLNDVCEDVRRIAGATDLPLLVFSQQRQGQGAALAAGAATVGRSAAPQSAAAVAAASARKVNPIGLSLFLPATQLVPGQTVDGAIVVKNQGDKTGVQFKIEVEGLDSDAYDLGSAPILFPDVEKQVLFRLRHPQKPRPPAGDRRLTVRVTAPNAYPGEVATASQVLQIMPYIKHGMSLENTT